VSVFLNGMLNPVPSQNSTANATLSDVIGNKTDTYAGDSVYALLKKAATVVSSEREVYPSLTTGASLVSANADWTYGEFTTVIPANEIEIGYHVLSINVESCDRNAVFQIEMCQGANDVPISTNRFAISGGFFGNQVDIIGSAVVPASARIRARIASSNGAAEIATIGISVVFWRFV
jgi:hypothetical protein